MTYFASEDRDTSEEIEKQIAGLSDNQIVSVLLESLEGYMVIFNEKRQLLAGNVDFLTSLCLESFQKIQGQRLGEILQCCNIDHAPSGCGTSHKCQNCGALLTMLSALEKDTPEEGECHITTNQKDHITAKEYKVKATPISLGGNRILVFVFKDISDTKRREILEQVFFHDVKNILGGISGWSEMLKLTNPNSAADKLVHMSRLLNLEVEGQYLLSHAETGSLEINPTLFSVETIFNDLGDIFTEHSAAVSRKLTYTSKDAQRFLTTDKGLLLRILVNMVKNALEATTIGETVEIFFEIPNERPEFSVHNPGGMSPEVSLRIFERSFSTKGIKGRGLGTYSMKLFGEGLLRGKVDFTTSTEAGTKFIIQLPTESLVNT